MKKWLGVSFVCGLLLCSGCSPTDAPPKSPAPPPHAPKENTTSVMTGNAMTIDYRIIIGTPLSPAEKKRSKRALKGFSAMSI